MKFSIFAFVTALALNSFAGGSVGSNYRLLTGEEKAKYIEAINFAIRQSTINFLCNDKDSYSLIQLTGDLNTRELYMSNNSQPTFISLTKADQGKNGLRVSLTTSSDNKSFSRLNWVSFRIARQNLGDLINPEFGNVEDPVQEYNCIATDTK